MPQPFRSKSPIKFGPNKLLERSELAAHMANVIADWRSVEEILELIHSQALRASISKQRQSHRVTDLFSHQIFEAVYVLDTKLKLVSGALRLLDSTEFQADFLKLYKNIKKLGKERNKIVHRTWGVCDNFTDALVMCSLSERTIYKLKDFVDLSDRIQHTAKVLLGFLSKLPNSRVADIQRD